MTESDPIPVDSEETCFHCRLEITHHRRLGASGGRGSEQSAEWNIVNPGLPPAATAGSGQAGRTFAQ